MAKKFIKRFMPQPHKFHFKTKMLNKFIQDPNFWYLNRYSVASAFSIGAFISYMPFPGHMLIAALVAVLFRANLPLAITCVWIANPFTMPFMFYYAYKLGTLLLNTAPLPFHFEISSQWVLHELSHYFYPLLVGSVVCGALLAVIGNIAIRLYWRYTVVKAWRKRQQNKLLTAINENV